MQIFTNPARILFLVLLPLPALSVASGGDGMAPPPMAGAETRAWLQLQSGGSHAGVAARQPGDAASRAYQRYLKSFEHPVPKSYFGEQEGIVNK